MQPNHLQLHLKFALAFLVTAALGALLVNLNEHNRVLNSQKSAVDIASIHGHLLQERVNRSLSATYALAAVLRQGQGEIDNFNELAAEMLHLYGGISALQLAPKGVITKIVPLAGNEGAIGHDLLQDGERNKEAIAAIQSRRLTLAGPFKLLQGGVAVVGRLPVFLPEVDGREGFWGFTTALIRITDLLEASKLNPIAESDYDFELSRIHPDNGQRDVFASSSQSPLEAPVSYTIEVPNGKWMLSIAPAGGWQSSSSTLGMEAMFVLLISVLVAVIVFNVLEQPYVLRREVAMRTHDLRESKRTLEAEIAERELAERALRESETRFRSMADTVPVLIWMAGVDGLASYFNREWLSFTGRSMEDECGEGWNEGLHGDDYRHCIESYRHAFISRLVFKHESRLRRCDGEYRWIAYHAIPRFTPEGDFAGYIGSGIDITDIKNAERVLRASNDELEHRVAERTHELTEANLALQQEKAHQQALISKLEDAQNQLLQAEKMASIGQLAAGIAHEINNPIGFIHSNLGALRHYMDDLLLLLAAYEAVEPVLAACPEALRTVSAAREKAELDYLREDLPKLLDETLDGVIRVKTIVQDLKEFSHVDEAEWQQADLHRGLDSTLNVVWNELKHKAEVIKDYGQLPMVECIAAQINQVFMNLLVNAAHAIEGKGVITLRSGLGDGSVWVEVADNGQGIPRDNVKRIFEPFFTTRPVGKGMGLGLSVSYGIVKKHGGRIDVRSEPGIGSAFRVWLPTTALADLNA